MFKILLISMMCVSLILANDGMPALKARGVDRRGCDYNELQCTKKQCCLRTHVNLVLFFV